MRRKSSAKTSKTSLRLHNRCFGKTIMHGRFHFFFRRSGVTDVLIRETECLVIHQEGEKVAECVISRWIADYRIERSGCVGSAFPYPFADASSASDGFRHVGSGGAK